MSKQDASGLNFCVEMATNGHSGYPLKWFKDQNAARHSWECAICLEVLKDPVQVRDCGHQFCALCIDDILKADPRCPSCRIEISDVMIFKDHAARRMIKQLDVNCCNEGCGWQGCLSTLLQDHQNSCSFLIRSGDNVHQLDVGKLEQKLETLMLKVSTLEKKHEQDSKELKLKNEEDIKELNLKHEQDKLKHEEDIKELKLKHEQDKLKYENELKAVKSKCENDLKQVQVKCENDMKQVQSKCENDMKQVQVMCENDMKQVQSKHADELKQFRTKHDEDVKILGQKIDMLQAIGAAHAPLTTQFLQRPLHQQEPEPDYTWKIANFTRKLAQAKSDNDYGTIQSEPFFSSHGYKMKLQVQLNEAPCGFVGYMGVYLGLMKSDRDGGLPWPFTKRCTFVLVDQQDNLSQRQNIQHAIVPEGEDVFKRPRHEVIEGYGTPQFVKHSTLHTRQYIQDHAVYIKFMVDP